MYTQLTLFEIDTKVDSTEHKVKQTKVDKVFDEFFQVIKDFYLSDQKRVITALNLRECEAIIKRFDKTTRSQMMVRLTEDFIAE